MKNSLFVYRMATLIRSTSIWPFHHLHDSLYCTAGAGFMALLIFAGFMALFSSRRSTLYSAFPRGPPSWPIIGHLPLLCAGTPHQTLAALSLRPEYGSIIGLHLGSIPAIVVSSPSLAKEVLLTQDKAFANRPAWTFADTLFYGYNTGVIWSSSCAHWSRLRKIYTHELLTAKRLQDLEYVREQAVARLLVRIVEASNGGMEAIDVGKLVGEMVSNRLSRLVQSKTLSESSCSRSDSLSELLKEVEQEIAPTIGDLFPWLRCFDVLQKHRMQQVHDRLDKTLESILMERREEMRCTPPNEVPHDFLQVLLSKEALDSEGLQKEPLQEEFLTPREVKAILMDVLGAGIHTTALSIEWAMAELLRNPRCFRKLRNEMDMVLGHDEGGQLVTDEDIPKLPYLQNIVKEVFRLHPAVPLLVPRISSEACKVGEYSLPAGTHVFVNVWAIGRDTNVWKEAERFWPDRFEGNMKDMDLRGQNYELLPFGSGRRICPGIRLGLSTVQVTVANLVKAFDWELPHGQTLDMSEKKGISNNRATPVLAIPKLRPAL